MHLPPLFWLAVVLVWCLAHPIRSRGYHFSAGFWREFFFSVGACFRFPCTNLFWFWFEMLSSGQNSVLGEDKLKGIDLSGFWKLTFLFSNKIKYIYLLVPVSINIVIVTEVFFGSSLFRYSLVQSLIYTSDFYVTIFMWQLLFACVDEQNWLIFVWLYLLKNWRFSFYVANKNGMHECMNHIDKCTGSSMTLWPWC